MAEEKDPRLEELVVLVVDCQTTGAMPGREHLLEVAWWRGRGDDRADGVESCLVELSEEHPVPPRVTRMTGIGEGLMTQAVPRETVHARLLAAMSPAHLCVAHYARFERRFLEHLHQEVTGEEGRLPLAFMCSHEIARRLLPEVPRKGLKALSGYLGFPMPELKRAAHHVGATVLIWKHLLSLLKDMGIERVSELDDLLGAPPPEPTSSWDFPLPREKRLALPDEPGVYRFLGPGGEVLYVGRATSLKARVNSYFRRRRGGGKALEIAVQARDIDWTLTPTRLEAGLLEAREIRRLEPPYNEAMRDRGKKTWHFSSDLGSAQEESDAEHSVGPVLGRESLEMVAELAEVLREGVWGSEESLAERLGLEHSRLERGALFEALSRFRQGEKARTLGPSARALMALGVRLQRERLQEQAEEQELVGEPEPDEETAKRGERPPANADQAERWLGSSLRHGVRQALRGRWFRLLAGATLRWNRSGEDPEEVHSLTVEDTPLDADTCVYLSVITGEIRRLVTGGRTVSLELPGGTTIDPVTLTRILGWI